MRRRSKLEILAACDFSEWRGWERAKQAGKDPFEVRGFGNVFTGGLYFAVTTLAGGVGREGTIESAKSSYQLLRDYYDSCPWDEINKHADDGDFKFLLDYRTGLENLEVRLDAFTHRCVAEDFAFSIGWQEFVELKEAMDYLLNMNYRRDVLRKFGIDLSEPDTYRDHAKQIVLERISSYLTNANHHMDQIGEYWDTFSRILTGTTHEQLREVLAEMDVIQEQLSRAPALSDFCVETYAARQGRSPDDYDRIPLLYEDGLIPHTSDSEVRFMGSAQGCEIIVSPERQSRGFVFPKYSTRAIGLRLKR